MSAGKVDRGRHDRFELEVAVSPDLWQAFTRPPVRGGWRRAVAAALPALRLGGTA